MSLAAAHFTYTIAGMALPITTLWVDRDSKYAAEVARDWRGQDSPPTKGYRLGLFALRGYISAC
jgi:hypothetical protein